MPEDASAHQEDPRSCNALRSPIIRPQSPMEAPARSCCSPASATRATRRASLPYASSFIKPIVSCHGKRQQNRTLLVDDDEYFDPSLPPLPYSPSEILSQHKGENRPRYYAYSPSQLARRDRYYETITTTTGDYIFHNREAMDKQIDAENEAFWLEVPVGQLDRVKRLLRRHPLVMCTTAAQWDELSSSSPPPPPQQQKQQQQRNEDNLVWSPSSPELPDLDELFCDQDDEDEDENHDDSLGPLAQYARENRRKRRRQVGATLVN